MRQQEAQLSEAAIKSNEQGLTLEKLAADKAKLEADLKQASKANQALQNELGAAQQKLKENVSQSQACKSQQCRLNEQELDAQLQKRTRELYDLTVKFGCLQSENGELKSQIDEKSIVMEQRLDSSRILMEQELQDACA